MELFSCAKAVLTPKQFEKFQKLDDTKLYVCVEDRQGGEFAVGDYGTIKWWVELALEWIDADDCIRDDQVFINSLLKGGEQAINQIDEFWDITIRAI